MTKPNNDGDGAESGNWLQFRNIMPDEVCQVVDIWKEVGLAQGVNNVNNFYRVYPGGFFVAVDTRTGEVVATCACARQHTSLYFIGQYAVRKKFQGQGVGTRLWRVMEQHLGDCNAGVTALPKRFTTFRDRAGLPFVEPWTTIIYRASTLKPANLPLPSDDLSVVPIDETLMPQVIAYDTLVHGYDRGKMIKLTMCDPKGISRAVVRREGRDDVVCGFGKINSSTLRGAVAQPIYAQDREVAAILLRNLVENKPEARVCISMYVPDCNRDACSLARDLGLTEHIRMHRCYRKGSVAVRLELVYAQHDLNFCIA